MKTLHEVLLDLRKKHSPYEGICTNVALRGDFEYPSSKLAELMWRWPKAETWRFPVPGGIDAYINAGKHGTMWDKTTEYGRLRHELLEFLIKETA